MFVSDEVIFLQLQKTAGTHIAAVLAEHLDGHMHGKHGSLDFDPAERLVFGSVRNPWDWYVSLWAYGCGTQGGVQGRLKTSKLDSVRRTIGASWRQPQAWAGMLKDLRANAGRDVGFWRNVYSDPLDPSRFRSWLKAILSPAGRQLLGADYSRRPLCGFAGFYTYRYLSIFTPVAKWQAEADKMRAHSDIAPFFAENGVAQLFVRNEQLEEDLADVFVRLGRPEVTADVLRGGRTNASRRGKAESYFDAESIALVAASDPYIIEKFGYSAPSGVGA